MTNKNMTDTKHAKLCGVAGGTGVYIRTGS